MTRPIKTAVSGRSAGYGARFSLAGLIKTAASGGYAGSGGRLSLTVRAGRAGFRIRAVLAAALFSPAVLFAQEGGLPGLDFTVSPLLAPFLADAPGIGSAAAVLLDAETGTVLYAKNPDREIPPASLTKLMTMHVALNEVRDGRASLDERLTVGAESWALRQPPGSSLMFLEPGQTVTLRELLLGLAVPSGNDAAVAVALRFAPSAGAFAEIMTREARRMGLARTRFVEPSGISGENVTTAAEFAVFAREYMRLYPESLAAFHSVPEFSYPKVENVPASARGRFQTITQGNRNALLRSFPGTDGLKTGYIEESGYNIALTAERNGTRFLAVILGAPSGSGGDRIRNLDGERLLSWAFANFKTVRPGSATVDPVRLWKGREGEAELTVEGPLTFTSPADRAGGIRFSVEVPENLIAPLPALYPVAWLVLSDEKGELGRARLLTAREYPAGGFFRRLWDGIRLLFAGGRG